MSRNLAAGLAIATLIVTITVLEIIASAKDLPHDGIQPDTTPASVSSTIR